eukprot:1946514-Rhodomonas_salina.2
MPGSGLAVVARGCLVLTEDRVLPGCNGSCEPAEQARVPGKQSLYQRCGSLPLISQCTSCYEMPIVLQCTPCYEMLYVVLKKVVPRPGKPVAMLAKTLLPVTVAHAQVRPTPAPLLHTYPPTCTSRVLARPPCRQASVFADSAAVYADGAAIYGGNADGDAVTCRSSRQATVALVLPFAYALSGTDIGHAPLPGSARGLPSPVIREVNSAIRLRVRRQ